MNVPCNFTLFELPTQVWTNSCSTSMRRDKTTNSLTGVVCSMNLLNSWLHDYGLAILALTTIIKLTLWPIQNRANRSMRQMAALSPKMQELRDKYKDDPTRMNQELMKLYKQYGINPVGGCLPMMIQIPIFFGLFKMLGQAVELRNAKFLWVKDLSQPDTIAHLPLLGWPVNIIPLCMALISAFIISLVVGPWIIRRLRIAQHGGETIREDTPERHRTKKGTPTMGGLVILTALIATTLLWANLANRYIWVAVLATGGFGLIGVWDDATKLRRRKGISTRVKFVAQVVVAFAVLQLVFWQPPSAWLPVLAIPFFKGWLVNLGWLWIPFTILVVVGASNAVNLTDGLDGLAIGPVIMDLTRERVQSQFSVALENEIRIIGE